MKKKKKRLTHSNLIEFIVNFFENLNTTYPHSEEFSKVIEDDDGTTVDSEKELSLEQKLELATAKKISTNQNAIQRNQLYSKPSDEELIYLKMRDLEENTSKKYIVH
ncbi:hypothetical protein TNCV_4108801 [Trichonephila clavipes]|nr:hypothetical protein TNCV_4108801 [Trichonephila clavipes]